MDSQGRTFVHSAMDPEKTDAVSPEPLFLDTPQGRKLAYRPATGRAPRCGLHPWPQLQHGRREMHGAGPLLPRERARLRPLRALGSREVLGNVARVHGDRVAGRRQRGAGTAHGGASGIYTMI